MRVTMAILAAAAVAGCVEPKVDVTEESCGAERLQYLVGQDEGALAAMTFEAGAVRVIRPGQAVTMDFSPSRLNLELDGSGRIQRVYCG